MKKGKTGTHQKASSSGESADSISTSPPPLATHTLSRTPTAAAPVSSQKEGTPAPKQPSSTFRQQTQDMLAQTAAFSASLLDVPEDSQATVVLLTLIY